MIKGPELSVLCKIACLLLPLKDEFHEGQDPILFILVLPVPGIVNGT